VGLGASDDDPILSLIDHSDIVVLVTLLLRRPQTSISFDIGETHGEGQVILLQVFSIGFDVFGVVRAILLVNSLTDHGEGIQPVFCDKFRTGGLPQTNSCPEFDNFS